MCDNDNEYASRQRVSRLSSPQCMTSAARELRYTTKSFSTWWAVPFSISVDKVVRSKYHAEHDQKQTRTAENSFWINKTFHCYIFHFVFHVYTSEDYKLFPAYSATKHGTKNGRGFRKKKTQRFRFRAQTHLSPQPRATTSSGVELFRTLNRFSRIFAFESVCIKSESWMRCARQSLAATQTPR